MKFLNYLPPSNIQYVIYKTTLSSIEYLTFSPIILSKLHPRYIVFSSSVVYFTISSFRITYCIDRNICKEKLNSTVQKIVIVTMFRLSSIFFIKRFYLNIVISSLRFERLSLKPNSNG